MALKTKPDLTPRSPVADIMPGFEATLEYNAIPPRSPGFALQDVLTFMKYGAQAIAQDEFTKCFQQKPRNSITDSHVLDTFYRYFVLFPYSSVLFFALLPIVLTLGEHIKRLFLVMYCKAFLASWGARIKRNGRKPTLKEPHIFVSNHTSIIDYVVLSADSFPHAVVAQKHGGILGFFLKHLFKLNGSLLMNRNEKKDRDLVSKKLREHVQTPMRSPLLIFPEGTCVNNEYSVLFHKGAFELDATVCPVAIKYDKSFADAYWHSKAQSFTQHLFYLMTRRNLVAEVWYLDPRPKSTNQTPVEFANEVKAEISAVARLKNLSWDGYFKNFSPPMEKRQKLKQIPRRRYGTVLMNRLARQSRATHNRRHSVEFECCEFQKLSHPYSINFVEPKKQIDENIATTNKVLIALQAAPVNEFVRKISGERNDIVSTWKQVKSRSSQLDEEEIHNRRIEYSSWRVWFKKRLEQEQQVLEDSSTLFEEEGVFHRVSSFLSTQTLFKLDDSPTIIPRTKSFGEIFGLMMNSSESPKPLNKRVNSVNSLDKLEMACK